MFTVIEIKEKVCDVIITKMNFDKDLDLNIYESLFEDGIGFDSIAYVEMICELENIFNIEILPTFFSEFKCIQDIIDYTEKCINIPEK